MSFTTVEIQVPEGMEEYVVMKDADDTAVLQRNALLQSSSIKIKIFPMAGQQKFWESIN